MEKSKAIQEIRNHVGWAYRELTWFTEEEAREANRERNRLLEALSDKISHSAKGSKIHRGPLSPGCNICMNGGWACNFITLQCSRDCFYCNRDTTLPSERNPRVDGCEITDPEDFLRFMKTFGIKGVGFSGGEPLLVPERLLAYVTSIKQAFGESVYMWVYTSGDHVSGEILQELRRAGLDEIRFDLTARKYDRSPLAAAKDHIPIVTVEIPAIPEDIEILKDLMRALDSERLAHLNLHQLHAGPHSYRRMIGRGYHFLHQRSVPVFESEMCALEMLLYAHECRLTLPINYCSSAYKIRFQGRDRMSRQSAIVVKSHEDITRAGYIRSISILDQPQQIHHLVSRLQEAGVEPSRWCTNDKLTEVGIHSSLLPYVGLSDSEIRMQYSIPGVRLKSREEGFVPENIMAANEMVYQVRGWSPTAVLAWRRLYMEGENRDTVFKDFLQKFPATGADTFAAIAREGHELKHVAQYEKLEEGFPEIF